MTDRTNLVRYPIPLYDGTIITIDNLPQQLEQRDADKICRVINALVEVKQNDR